MGGAGAAALGALAACTGSENVPGSGPSDPSTFEWPNHVPFQGPPADLPGTPDGVNPGFLRYPPAESRIATTSGPPGDGSPITAMTPNFSAARPSMGQNSFWQNLNELLGSEFDAQLVPGADYTNVFATTVASGSLPDLFTLYRAPRLPELLRSQAVDLTDFVAGGAIETYPNLANIPSNAWRFSVYSDRIYTIPLFRGLRTSAILFQRSDLLGELGLNTAPSDFEEFLEIALEVTDPARNRWAFSNFPTEFLRQSLGIGNLWVEEDGRFSSAWADERQQDFFEAGRRLIEAGVIHPDGFTGTGHKDRFMSGECFYVHDGMSAWGGYYTSVASSNPALIETFQIDGVPVFDHSDGFEGAPWRGPDVAEQCGIGRGATDRIETVLAVANYLAAPLGSEEKLNAMYGVEGAHYDFVDGEPIRTELGATEWLNLGLLMSSPFEVEVAGHPDAVSMQHRFQTYLSEQAQRNAADGLYSEALVSNGGALNLELADLTNEILQGRQRPDSWEPALENFKAGGGDEIAEELAEALAEGGS